LTGSDSEAIAANEYAGDVEEDAEAQRRRSRIQHEADPYASDSDDDGCVMDEAIVADLGKRFRNAYDTPSGYPVMDQVDAEMFRRGPTVAGEAAYGPGYAGFAPDACPVPVPSATVSAAAITRPLITEASHPLRGRVNLREHPGQVGATGTAGRGPPVAGRAVPARRDWPSGRATAAIRSDHADHPPPYPRSGNWTPSRCSRLDCYRHLQ